MTSTGGGDGSGGTGQAAAAIANQIVAKQVQQVVDKELDQYGPARFASGLTSANHHTFNNGLSFFATSGVAYVRHDGLDIVDAAGDSVGPSFDALAYIAALGVRFDGSSVLGLAPKTVMFGAFGNYTTSDISFDGVEENQLGDSAVNSYGLGGYSLINLQPFYLLGVFSYGWGNAEFADGPGLPSDDYGLSGYAISANAGVVLPLQERLKLDLRAGFNYAASDGANYVDGAGFVYNDARVEDLSGTASAKLFSVHRVGEWTLRPFIQGGGSQRIDYTNELSINGELHQFDDAESSFFGRAGLDIDQGDRVQSYIAVRADASEKSETISGQIGLTVKLD